MNRYLDKNNINKTFQVEPISYDTNTQPYTLAEGMPLISRLNFKTLDVLNNEIFICDKIIKDDIKVSNELKKLKIPKDKFNKLFLLAFCITTHKSQALSLNEKYCIHEFQKFDKKLKYVALSRSTKYNHIHIIPF